MAAASKLSSKYQVSIPKAVRERMAWRPGQKIAFIARADGVFVADARIKATPYQPQDPFLRKLR